MSYHTALSKSYDFYTSMKRARAIADDVQKTLSKEHGEDVVFFPYSIFYVFYEQYLTIWKDAVFSLLLSLITIFSVSFVLTGFDLLSAVVILLMVTLILINMLGLMYFWNITLNAVSLVNLVVVRISVHDLMI